MEDRKFDNLARLIGRGASRRSVFKGLFGLGGAAAAGGVATSDADARALRTRPTVPPPSGPACALPKQMCGDICCDAGRCKDGICCSVAAYPDDAVVNCGGVCCASGICAGTQCCDAGEEACGTVCCEPRDTPAAHNGQISKCARDGNVDFCCETDFPCGLDCCSYEHQCCDRECCADGTACIVSVYGEEGEYEPNKEEICCPIPQICGNTCCEGTCYDPGANEFPSLDPTEINEWAACCPEGGVVCAGPLDDANGIGTVCCEDPTTRCCVREDDPNAGIAQCLTTEQCCFDDECTDTGPDACLVPNCEGDGTCTYTPDNALCTATGEDGCLVGVCNSDGTCTYTPSNDLCAATGPDGCLNGTCSAEGTCSYVPDATQCQAGGNCSIATCSDEGVCGNDPDQTDCDALGPCAVCTGSSEAGYSCTARPDTYVCQTFDDEICLPGNVACDPQSDTPFECPDPVYPSQGTDCGACSECDGDGNCTFLCNGCQECNEETNSCDPIRPIASDPNDFCPGNQVCCGGECASITSNACNCTLNGGNEACGFCQYCGEGFCWDASGTDPQGQCGECGVCDGAGACTDVEDTTPCAETDGVCCNGSCRAGGEDCVFPCTNAQSCANDLGGDATCWSCNEGQCVALPGRVDENGMPAGFCTGEGTYLPGPDACESGEDCPTAGGCYTGECSNGACVTLPCGVNEVCCRGTCKMDDAVSASAQALICPICATNDDCCSGCCHYAPCWGPCEGNDDAFLPLDGQIGGQNCYRADFPARVGHCHHADESFNGEFLCTACIPLYGYCGGGNEALCCGGETCTDGYCGGPYVGTAAIQSFDECSPKDICETDECGDVDDGCGGTINCGECVDESTTPAPECIPTTCEELGCGATADDCAGTQTYCGDCETGIPDGGEGDVVCLGDGETCVSDIDCCTGLCRDSDCAQVGELTCTTGCGTANG